MDMNEFSFVVNVCGGKDKDFIKDFLNKRYKNEQDFLVLFIKKMNKSGKNGKNKRKRFGNCFEKGFEN